MNNIKFKTTAEARRMYREWLYNQTDRDVNPLKTIEYAIIHIEDEGNTTQKPSTISKDLKRQLNLDKKYQDYNWHVDFVIDTFITGFDVSEKIRKNIIYYIKVRNPTNNGEVIEAFLDFVKERNPPITNTEIWDEVSKLKGGALFKDKIFVERNYDWYITNILYRFPPECFELLPIIKEKYDIYQKHYSDSNPLVLIKFLCYRELKKITKCTLKMLDITTFSNMKYKERFEELGL